MPIRLKRAYDAAAKADGYRILIERLWPRGVSKDDARLDDWAKAASPSTALRKWFGHEPDKWPEFKRRYFAELENDAEAQSAVAEIVERARTGTVTFVYGSKETRYNAAVALCKYVESRI